MITALQSSKHFAFFSRLFLILAILAGLAYQQRSDGRLHIMLPALKGDAILIQTPDGEFVLIDGGAEPSSLSAALGRAMPYWKRDLAMVILTSSDTRHLPGQLAALAHYQVRRVLAHPQALQSSGASMREWHRLVREQNVPVLALQNGQRIGLGSRLSLKIALADESCLLRIEYAQTAAVLAHSAAPDAHELNSSTTTQLVVFPWDYDPHGALLEALRPQVIVYSDGAQAEEPVHLSMHDRRIGRAAQYHEALHGDIEWISDGRRGWVAAQSLAPLPTQSIPR